MEVIVTGGGTAGHVTPALAIATELRARGHDVHVVGSERGIEVRLVPEAGFPLTVLPGRGIQRRLTTANLAAAWGLLRALVQAARLVQRRRPGAVVAVGGYASVAVGLAAALWKIPLVVHEQNAVPGAANRLLARLARATATSFPDTPLPRAEVVGNPVAAELFGVGERHRPDGRAQLLVVGGSLGALSINRATVGAAERWRDRTDLAIRHVIGRRDFPTLPRPDLGATGGGLEYVPVEYEDDMAGALAAADLVVCRAGSGTLFELAAAGVPAVVVPSEVTTAGQQLRNAERAAATGGAVVVPDAELDADRLVAEVDRLLADRPRLAEMARSIRSLAAPDAAAKVADLVERHGRRPPAHLRGAA